MTVNTMASPRDGAYPGPRVELHRLVLDNGLRVLLAPDPDASVVGVAVHYDVGMRSEPEGRTGFAHLFEHLMFQGSRNLPKHEHFRYVESSGGNFNGSTHFDYTQYYEVLPSSALERGLFLEADRMREPALSADNLELQREVVKEEIRLKVHNRPYGGFPWIRMGAVLFDSFANAHDGYGSFEDLETATVEDARQFFDRYYSPTNALLCVAGGFDADTAARMVRRHFESIESRPAPPRRDFGEPGLTAHRHVVHVDRHAPLPALAIGWRVPDPVARRADYLPYVVLSKIMSGGSQSRLERRLVRSDRSVTQQACYLGLLSNPLDVRDPTCLIYSAKHPPAVPFGSVVDAVTEELARVADNGLDPGELNRTMNRMTIQILREADSVVSRCQTLASLELQHGRAELLAELPGLLAAITEDEVRAAAAALANAYRAVVEIRPGRSGRSGTAAGQLS